MLDFLTKISMCKQHTGRCLSRWYRASNNPHFNACNIQSDVTKCGMVPATTSTCMVHGKNQYFSSHTPNTDILRW